MNENEIVEMDKSPLDSAEGFANALQKEKAKRELLKEFIKDGLTEGQDYGKIKIGGRDSKPTLFKSGAEKFNSLLELVAHFTTDNETRDQLPTAIKEQGVFCYDCVLKRKSTGEFIAQGKGACTIKEKRNDVNVAIKIAKKRSLLDAVLGIGLSDTFTQDLDDMSFDQEKPKSTGKRAPDGSQSIPESKVKEMLHELITMYTALKEKGTNFTEQQTQFVDECLAGNKEPMEVYTVYEKVKELYDGSKSSQS